MVAAHDRLSPTSGGDAAYRRVLWAALAINAVMFVIEVSAGLGAASLSIQADSLDFLGDAANYGVALFVLGLPLRWRATTALLKAAAMALFGLWIFAQAADQALHPGLPSAAVMSGIGMLALAANLACALLLYRHRFGDSNRRAVWLCTRNDAFGNIAVIAAAGGVYVSAGPWPDVAVGVLLSSLAFVSALRVTRQAVAELKREATRTPA